MSIISTDISKAVQLLNNEELVAIPTETVYGLAGNIFSERAVKAIFKTKQRPFFNPLIVHIPSSEVLPAIVRHIPEKAKLLAETMWPGPLTLVLPKNQNIPELITAGKDTVAVRVPNHPITQQLLNRLDFPLAAPSANPFGSISPTTAEHVAGYFKNDIKMVLDGGPCQRGIESTIIGFENDEPIVYRLGSTTVEAIESIMGTITLKNKKEIAPDAPGMLDRHYAPKTTTLLTDDILGVVENHKNKRIGLLLYQMPKADLNVAFQLVLTKTNDLQEAASKLYDALHLLDKQDLDLIIAERFPDVGLGKSINDRLYRATKK